MSIDFELYSICFKGGIKMACILVPLKEGGYNFIAIDLWAFGTTEYYETMDEFFKHYRDDPAVERLIKIA